MSNELEQFHAGFFEESREALDTMEAVLLQIDAQGADPETINTIFRVAHSIKGGAGMFGFNDITSFTHTLETLLDELRSGRRALDGQISNALLQSVDVLKALLGVVQHGKAADATQVAELHARLTALVASEGAGTPPAATPRPAVVVPTAKPATLPACDEWAISFKPLPELLNRGNDPLRLFLELGGLGPLQVKADLGALLPLAQLDPERCVICWNLALTSAGPREAIELIFEWAQGDCELEIERKVAPAPAALPAEAAARPPGSDAGSIRVSIEKIDELLNTVGEIVITQSMLSQLALKLDGPLADRMKTGLALLESNIRELRESVMRVRMLPVGSVFSRFPRLTRDLSQRLGKQIRLKMTGEQTEMDKTVLEKIGDPLVHLVRNSIDHGIEMPDVRAAAGKPVEGTVHLHAFHKGGSITLEVSDDGKGLDRQRILDKARSHGLVGPQDVLTEEQVNDLIFLPGFSTADAATDLSGRGVGMDVVRRNIKELGGTIELRSEMGKGTRFVINLPLTLAVVDGQSVAVGTQIYIVPLVTIVESLQLRAGMANHLVGNADVFSFRGEYLPIIRLHEVFGVVPRTTQLHEGLIMVVEGDGRKVGLFVDELLGQQQVVIKSIESNYGHIDGVGGATILGEGTVALILDVPGLIRIAGVHGALPAPPDPSPVASLEQRSRNATMRSRPPQTNRTIFGKTRTLQ